jgi:porin
MGSPTENITLAAAVFNGNPAGTGIGDPQVRDASGTLFLVNEGVFVVAEAAFSIAQKTPWPGTYKIGAWYNSNAFASPLRDIQGLSLANPASSGIPGRLWNDYAIYVVADQMIWHKPGTKDAGVGVFALATAAPQDRNLSNFFAMAGVNWKGILRDDDVFGLGVAYLRISNSLRQFSADLAFVTGFGQPFATNETVLEATYQYPLTPWLTLQPSLQYIINPGAGIPSPSNGFSRSPLKNATTMGLRATVVF